jgi:hypothetical protein
MLGHPWLFTRTSQPNPASDFLDTTLVPDPSEPDGCCAGAPSPNRSPAGAAVYTPLVVDPEPGLVLTETRGLLLTEGEWMTEDPVGCHGDDANMYRYVGQPATDAGSAKADR